MSGNLLIEEWQNNRGDVGSKFKKLIQKLLKMDVKKVNEMANELHEEVFSEIDCLDCAACCKDIPPMINQADINRIAKSLRIPPTTFKSQFLKLDDDQDQVLVTTPCPFLEEDNRCNIYESRPKACRRYPHTDQHDFFKKPWLPLTNAQYCPAVYHILERMNKRL